MRIKLEEGATIPTKGTEGSAAYDIYSNEGCVVCPHSTRTICTGISLEIPRGYCGILTHRSGMNIKGASVYGLIDSDFRQEVKVIMHNNTDRFIEIDRGMRIAQLRFTEAVTTSFEVVDELTKTDRDGGFGSTGA